MAVLEGRGAAHRAVCTGSSTLLGAELSLAHLNTLALRQPCLAGHKNMQIRATHRPGVIRNVEEEVKKEPDKVQGQCRVGISSIRITEYTQVLFSALPIIPIQAWPRAGLIFFLSKS